MDDVQRTELLAALDAAKNEEPRDPKLWRLDDMRRRAAIRARGEG